ncbi:DNA polymerase III subunit alpha [Pedobacter mucosus]|uniref:DNA polymerase III subunit alpha n=1 Tax=Pedobacter mucosus TaxID=2895286 RepID=UPI001EE4E269|nr:DNA polymerase III subunit alpha [Pedobacter mucosus]UKT65785.1 DNA polymerase III subunit alpha [Pedobacter mucosus]
MFLNVHSSYSLKYGTIDIKGIVKQARALGIRQLVLTDINNSTGAMEFIRQCEKQKIKVEKSDSDNGNDPYLIKPITGIEFRLNNQLLYIGIAQNKEGMKELNDFLTWHNLNEHSLPLEAPQFENIFVLYPFSKGHQRDLRANEFLAIRQEQLNLLYALPISNLRDKLVIWHPVTISDKYEYRLHEYLRAVSLSTLLTMVSDEDKCSKKEKFISEEELKNQFSEYPFIIENTAKLLNACSMDGYISGGKFSKNKKTYTKTGCKADTVLLKRLAYKGLAYRYGLNNEEARKRVEKELKVIEALDYCAYFLITFDIIRFAIEKCKFYHVGRGSGANSIVAYCLRITDVDPIELDLYFERFLNEKRTSPPDFDIDFSWDERGVIQQYIFNRYPTGHVAFLGTMSTFKDRAIIREIGKVLGLPKGEIDSFTDPTKERENLLNPTYQKLKFVHQLMKDMPNQRSIHAGGILISEEPITYYTALDLPPKGFPTVQWDMYEAEAIGYEKFDILSQRGIGHIREAVKIIKENCGRDVDIHDFPKFKKDPKLNAELREGQPIGCFYIESPAMRQLLKKLTCDDYLTLVAASSIIRPGVASSGMMKTYIQSYHAPEQVKYLHPVMKEQLEETFGVMVYQEDVIKICHHYAGLGLADADILRRAMSGKYRSKLEFDKLVQRFFDHAKRLGRDEETTKEVWRQVSSFAGYSFSKAHSASFAVESYQSLYLKTYYPKEFMVAVLNNYGGFYTRWVYVHELQKTGANVHLPCVNRSDEVVNIKGNDAYLGFIGVQGLENKFIQCIPQERNLNGPFKDLEEFVKRTQITLEQAILLIRLGALRFTGKDKKTLLWEIYTYLGHSQKRLNTAELFNIEHKEYTLPKLENSALEDAYTELELLDFPLNFNMFDFLKTDYRGDVMAADLNNNIGKTVKMVGNYVCEKTVHTIKNTKMWFGTFLDKNGDFFDTTHFPNTTPMYPFKGKGCYLILGKVVEDFGFPSVEVLKFAKLDIQMNPVAAD